MFKTSLKTLIFSAFTVGFVPTAWAQDVQIPFDGFMTDGANEPIDGTLDVEVRIYDAAADGNELFYELHTGVLVDGGFFFINIGSTEAFDARVFEPTDASLLGNN